MSGKGYTSDDNRSMQLNDNNDRYYSSRGIDRDDDYDDYEHGGSSNVQQKATFQDYVPFVDWFPYFKAWIQNLKINMGESYEIKGKLNGLTTVQYVEHFKGFNLWNSEHKTTWNYYKTRALVDYCVDKGLKWTVAYGQVVEYKVENWSNFGFEAENIMYVNQVIYENNGLLFPNNANELFLTTRGVGGYVL